MYPVRPRTLSALRAPATARDRRALWDRGRTRSAVAPGPDAPTGGRATVEFMLTPCAGRPSAAWLTP